MLENHKSLSLSFIFLKEKKRKQHVRSGHLLGQVTQLDTQKKGAQSSQ